MNNTDEGSVAFFSFKLELPIQPHVCEIKCCGIQDNYIYELLWDFNARDLQLKQKTCFQSLCWPMLHDFEFKTTGSPLTSKLFKKQWKKQCLKWYIYAEL